MEMAMKHKILTLIIALCLFIILLAVAQAQAELEEYKIAAEDVLQVSVYEEPDLDSRVRVSSNGEVTLPLINKVGIAGLTIRQAEEKIAGMLKEKYLVNPQVSIFIDSYHTRQITVLGEVAKPGASELGNEKSITAMEAIAMAGGFTQKADLNNVKVIRLEKEGEKINIPVRVSDITKKGDKDKDIVLEADDIVFVPESYERKISVMGEVKTAGTYEYSKDNPITVTEAIAMAEWFNETADLKDVKIIRKNRDSKDIIPVDVTEILEKGDKSKDIPLEPYDIVFIPRMYERKFSVMGEVDKPGAYELNKKKPITVMEAIAMAGGFTDKAVKNSIKLIRVKDGKKEIIPINIISLTKRTDRGKDIVIEPDDIIFVPESFW